MKFILLFFVLLSSSISPAQAAKSKKNKPKRVQAQTQQPQGVAFKDKIMERFELIYPKKSYPLSENLKKLAQNRTFIGYPGGIGLQAWVFYDNFESLRKDFGVPEIQIWHRDAINGLHVSHTAEQGIWGMTVKHVSRSNGGRGEVQLDQEALALKNIYEITGKPLVIICHSGQCANMFNTAMYLRHEIGEGKMIDRVVVLQGGKMLNGNNVRQNIAHADGVKKRILKNSPNQLPDARTNDLFDLAPLAQNVFYVGDNGQRNGPTREHGRFLGDLYFDHTTAVVCRSQTEPGKGTKVEYRYALTQVLLETLYPEYAQ